MGIGGQTSTRRAEGPMHPRPLPNRAVRLGLAMAATVTLGGLGATACSDGSERSAGGGAHPAHLPTCFHASTASLRSWGPWGTGASAVAAKRPAMAKPLPAGPAGTTEALRRLRSVMKI